MPGLEFQLWSNPEEEELTAELLLDERILGHVVRRGGGLELRLVPSDDGVIVIHLSSLEKLLQDIRRRLETASNEEE